MGPLGTPAPADINDLPAEMQTVAAIIGPDRLADLLIQLGGSREYIAARPGELSPLAQAIGLEAAQRLGEEYGGTHLSVPKCNSWVARHLAAKKLPQRQIARRLRCKEDTVRNYLFPQRQAAGQFDLFQRLGHSPAR